MPPDAAHRPRPTVVVLDGGMGQELVRRGVGGGPGWSLGALWHAPDAVVEVHRANLEAGAHVITANSYAVSRQRLTAADIDVPLATAGALAVELARTAVRDAGDDGARVAGSLGPLGGSYAPEAVPPTGDVRAQYDELVRGMADAGADLVLAETLSTAREAAAAVEAAREVGLEVWVSWTPRADAPDRLLDGSALADAVAGVPADAHLVNCTAPEVIDRAVPVLAAAGARFGAYANAFADVPDGWRSTGDDPLPDRREDLGPAPYADHADRWVAAGATVVGGCCEIGPAHVRALAARHS